jgi:hypothetical protein
MKDFAYRVKLLESLIGYGGQYVLNSETSFLSESAFQTTVRLKRFKSNYTVECIARDLSESSDNVELFYEILANGTLMSGLRRNAESLINCPELDDQSLDYVLNQALYSVCH